MTMARACSYAFHDGCGLATTIVLHGVVVLWKLKFVKDEILNLSHGGLLDILFRCRSSCGYRLSVGRVNGEVLKSGRLVGLGVEDLGVEARVNIFEPEVVPLFDRAKL